MGLDRHQLGPQSPATVPPARQLAGMAYDTGVSQLLLFGGIAVGLR